MVSLGFIHVPPMEEKVFQTVREADCSGKGRRVPGEVAAVRRLLPLMRAEACTIKAPELVGSLPVHCSPAAHFCTVGTSTLRLLL